MRCSYPKLENPSSSADLPSPAEAGYAKAGAASALSRRRMGERPNGALRLKFDSSLKLEFHGAMVTSDAGLLAYRELDEQFGLTRFAAHKLVDARRGKNTQHSMVVLLRQAVYGRIAGYEDTNDADHLRIDPAMRRVVGGRAEKKLAASTSEMDRFEAEFLPTEDNLQVLSSLCGAWVDRLGRQTRLKDLILDMDSSESPAYGRREGSAYNGYFGCNCYHPLFCFNQFGDVEVAILREGNVHSAHQWRSLLEPVVQRYRRRRMGRLFRADAAFADPEVYRYLEREGFLYAIRLPGNDVLYEAIRHLWSRPVRRPSREPKVT